MAIVEAHIVEAKIVSITPDKTKVTVRPLKGPFKDRVFGFLWARAGNTHGQFVEIDMHPSGECVDWPSS